MDSVFINSKNRRTFEYHVFILKLTDQLNLRTGKKSIPLSNLSINYTWKNISLCSNNKFSSNME